MAVETSNRSNLSLKLVDTPNLSCYALYWLSMGWVKEINPGTKSTMLYLDLINSTYLIGQF